MYVSSLLAAGVLATQASAFLVPLEVAKVVQDAEDKLQPPHLSTKSQSISLECPGCQFDTANDRQDAYADNAENILALNFAINDVDNSLTLNEKKIYPLEFPYPLDLYAPLVRSSNGLKSPPVHLGFALEYLPTFDAPEGTLVPIHLTIVDLDGIAVKVPTVAIDIIKVSKSEELKIVRTNEIPFEESPGSDCDNALCRAREIALAHLRGMMDGARAHAGKVGEKMGMKSPCPGKMGHKGKGIRLEEMEIEGMDDDLHELPPNFHPHKLPGHKRPHRHHHHGVHGFVHKAMHLFVIPALLGIIGGLTASAIGMFVGQSIVFLWFRFIRGGRRGQVSDSRREAALDEEKEALVEDDYESPPVYEEAVEGKH